MANALILPDFVAGTDPASTGNGFFTITLTGINSGNSLANQAYAGWCGAWHNSPIETNGFPGAPVASTYSASSLPAGYAPIVAGNTLNMVNYILNNKQGTVQDVQDAIWLIMTGQTPAPVSASATAMVAAAKLNPAYIPNPGGVVAILYAWDSAGVQPDATSAALHLQDMLFEVPVPTSTTQGGGGTGSNICGLSPGYWKNHTTLWPVTYLQLGDRMYNQAQLLPLLSAPKKGDDSLILAFQLIAAKLNVANGTNVATAGTNITQADALLTGYSKALPYGAKSTQMNAIATNLNAFNNDGQLQPGCKMP